MPVRPEVLGFSNHWSPCAAETAETVDLGNGITIRLVSAMAFAATKLEAIGSRAGGDFLTSHDLEDMLLGLLPEPARAGLVMKRLKALSL